MGTTWKLILVVCSRARLAFLVCAAMMIACTSTTHLFACTPVGVQCPTARVQLVTIPVSDCCGKIVGYASRKPIPGERGFVQCRCAEKRTSQQQANVGQSAPHFEMFVTEPLAFVVPERLKETKVASTSSARIASLAAVPLVPPPALI
jgi:hypothetical protein